MRAVVRPAGLFALVVAATAVRGQVPVEPRHFVFFNLDRHRISEESFLTNPGVAGAQLKYTWRELEPERDVYALDAIARDLEFLERHGKSLFLHVQDVSFDGSIVNVPDYLLDDPAFGGGAARQYEAPDDGGPAVPYGWVARRWDPRVRERLVRLVRAIAGEFDGRIAGLNLAETSIGFGDESYWPEDYDPDTYATGIEALIAALGETFETSDVLLYANFMPGESLPDRDRGYLRSVYEEAARHGIGVGGPDILPRRWYQRQHSLPLIAGRPAGVVAGMAVQDGNLEDRDRRTGEQVTVEELAAYARGYLHLDYVFWGTQEPFYSRDVLPYLARLGGAD